MMVGIALLVLAPAVLSCRSSATPPTVRVRGTVTYLGKPAEGVSVGFIPENGRPASGLTDSSGKFALSTFRTGDGAVPGKHKVLITEGTAGDGTPPMPGMPEYEPWQSRKSRYPARYADVKTTPLNVQVTPGRINEFTFDLAD